MNDSELCKMFGTTVEQVESDCEKYESGDFSGWEFGKPIDGHEDHLAQVLRDRADGHRQRCQAARPDALGVHPQGVRQRDYGHSLGRS